MRARIKRAQIVGARIVGARPVRARKVAATLVGALLMVGVGACGSGTDATDAPSGPAAPPPRSLAPAPDSSGASSSDSPSDSDEESEDENKDRKPRNEEGVEVGARAGQFPLPAVQPVDCPRATVPVGNAEELTAALAAAQPGQVIGLADGVFEGAFVASKSGRQDSPIYLCGSRAAVLDGGEVDGGYTLHLDGATHWRLIGFSLRGGQKGLMADGTVGSVIQGLSVTGTGDEAIHLRRTSTDNLVLRNEIGNTGNRRDKFGEGVYIGTAVSNWCTISDCLPDRSDRNVIAENTISGTTSENVDIKEGTTGGLLIGNSFDGARTEAADSWVDVKGTAWTIKNNRGTDNPLDGFQTHQIEDRWGERNLFEGNTITSGPTTDKDGDPGYGIALRPEGDNIVRCSNTVTGGITLANVDCG